MRRRGITLMELLLACALFVVLGAIALPAMLESSEHARLNEAAEVIEEQLLLARAHAMVEGVSVEVQLDPRTRRVEVVEAHAVRAEDAARERVGEQIERPGEAQYDHRDAALVARHWASVVLPEGVTLSLEEPPALAALADGDEATGLVIEPEAEGDDATGEARAAVTLLVLYLPDGSAPVVEPIWLSTDDGRAMRIDVGRWTGIPRIDRAPAVEEPDAGEEDASEEADETADDDDSATEQMTGAAESSGDESEDDSNRGEANGIGGDEDEDKEAEGSDSRARGER